MSKGVIAGVGAGSVVAVLGLGFASVTLPPVSAPTVATLPAPAATSSEAQTAPVTPAPGLPVPAGSPETALSVPAASEFARGATDQAPVPPTPTPMAPQSTAVSPEAPVALPETMPATLGTEPPTRPATAPEAPAAPAAPETATAALDVAPEAEAPVGVPPPGEAVAPDLPEVEAAPAPVVPAPETTLEPALEPAAEPTAEAAPAAEPEAKPPSAAPAPAAEPAPVSPAPTPETTPEVAADTGEITLMPDGALVPSTDLPRVFSAGEGNTGFASVEGTRVNRLPQIGAATQAPSLPGEAAPETPASRLPQIEPAAPDAPGADAPEAEAPLAPALERFAAPFTATPGLPFVSVVLIDTGTEAGALDRDTLIALGLPLTIALDPTRPDVTEAAAAYRAAGFEVAILAQPLPAGAAAQDLEVAFAEWHRRLPEAVALVEPDKPALQTSAPLVKQVVRALGAEGMAYVTQSLGVASAAQVARGAGLPETSIWRVLDQRRDKAPAIARTLARAAFEASRKGGVVVMLSAWPESIAGLQTWAPEAQGKVDLAPLSVAVQPKAP